MIDIKNNNLKNCLTKYEILTRLENVCIKNNKDFSGVLKMKIKIYYEIKNIRDSKKI